MATPHATAGTALVSASQADDPDAARSTRRTRRSTGGVVEKATTRGISYGLRFRAYGQRRYVHLGHEIDGWTQERARSELAYVLAQVERNEWSPRAEPEPPPADAPTFHIFASEWLADREPELRVATIATYRWELTNHLLPVFASKRVDEIDVAAVDAYRRLKVREAKLGPTSINKTITRLGQILDVAQERGLIVQNPVRVNPRNRKVKSVRPRRPWLEPEQVLALLDAAGELDHETERGLPIRRPLLATLAWAGLRIAEATALRWRHIDLAGGTIHVEQSKTDAGIRALDVQPELHDELVTWRARTPFAEPDDLVFSTKSGSAMNRHNVRQRVVLKAAERANEHLGKHGRPELPEGLSPHALRRSFASWLIAEGEDVAYVQNQLGHTDPTMTLGIYAQAVRNGRRTVRSRRRMEALERVPTGTGPHDVAQDDHGRAVA